RPDRAARAADEGRRPAGVTVETPDRVDPRVRVAVVLEPAAGRHVLAVVEVPTVRRDLRLARVLLPVPALRELEPVPAPDVPHPHLARAERARIPVVFPPDQVLAVRRPDRVHDLTLALLRDLARVRA